MMTANNPDVLSLLRWRELALERRDHETAEALLIRMQKFLVPTPHKTKAEKQLRKEISEEEERHKAQEHLARRRELARQRKRAKAECVRATNVGPAVADDMRVTSGLSVDA
jgi:hypothetical protein